MHDQVGHVLYEKQSRPEKGHVFRKRCEDSVMSVPPVVVAIPELTKSFAWWASDQQVEITNPSAVGSDETSSFVTQKIALNGDFVSDVVVVDRNRLHPRVVRLDDLKPELPKANPDASEPRAKLYGDTSWSFAHSAGSAPPGNVTTVGSRRNSPFSQISTSPTLFTRSPLQITGRIPFQARL
jgi:hypothetical protein